MNNYNTQSEGCQAPSGEHFKLLKKLALKRNYNKDIIDWLCEKKDFNRAEKIRNCATYIGITDEDDVTKIVKANFCRQRICNVCAWRRQSKFIAQTNPMLNILSNKGYEFLFATLTVKNCDRERIYNTVDKMLQAYFKLLQRAVIKKAFKGIIRGLEITYNADSNTYHPHVHMLIAVNSNYFTDPLIYINQQKLSELWREVMKLEYTPVVDIRKVESSTKAAVETLKYSLKPTQYKEALSVLYSTLKGRRLISFSGIFAQLRKELKYTDFDTDLTDDIKPGKRVLYNYKFDVTGGFYNFQNAYEIT